MERRKFTICCDMDDTIEDLLGPWVKWLNLEHNLDVKVEDIKSWEMKQSFPTLTDYQIFKPLNTPEFWDYVKPKLNSVYWLYKLIEDGHKVYICTNSHYKIVEAKFDRVLFKHFPYLTWKDVIIMKDKHMIKCDYLIDDGVHNIVGDYKGLLIDMPHNKGFNHENVIRVYDFEAVYNIINQDAMN